MWNVNGDKSSTSKILLASLYYLVSFTEDNQKVSKWLNIFWKRQPLVNRSIVLVATRSRIINYYDKTIDSKNLFVLNDSTCAYFMEPLTFNNLVERKYRIYSKERLCSKERLPRISAPLLSKVALFWKIVFKGGAHLGST